jgi:hypothetical protein
VSLPGGPAFGPLPLALDYGFPTAGRPADNARTVSHRSANFVVYAPTAVAARVVAGEAEYQRQQIAKEWLGKPLPNWEKPATVVVSFGWGGESGASTLTFADAKAGPKVAGIEIRLDGFTLQALEGPLPREVAQAVLATHFGRPVPRWAGGGVALLHDSDDEQAKNDTAVRQLPTTAAESAWRRCSA